MEDAQARAGGVAWTVLGCLLILVSGPLLLLVAPSLKGLGVAAAGLIALAVLVVGVVLAGRWLGVFQRRRAGSAEQPGWLPLLVTLLTLLNATVILYYVVYYCAAVVLGGWNNV